MRFILIVTVLLLLYANQVEGQISYGGRPVKVPVLKSSSTSIIDMPSVINEDLRMLYNELDSVPLQLKSFIFAHTFDVDISPSNSGVWIRNFNGYDVWQVKVRSAGAFSLNIIFENFELNEGARLFLYNEQENHYLGAFTAENNRESGKFAVSPVAGDELTIQYEVPAGLNAENDFIITQVNHDFIGILKLNERRPTGVTAGSCNVNVNCDVANSYLNQMDAVCRIIVNGREICSGVLMNNSAEDQRPYILSASHCYDRADLAEKSVFTFNFESPYCSSLDGDPSNSISGASMKAYSDSLDFALVEMAVVPPPHFMPYYAGWDHSELLPDSSFSIHHPQGGIKKVSIDRDAPSVSDFTLDYARNAFLRIHRWEEGVTEQGSSGGPLFNPSGNVIGTLTGGNATCRVPVNDFYSRFSMAWEYETDSTKQLKYWLDPLDRNRKTQQGKRFYKDEDQCIAFTNLEDVDNHSQIVINTATGNAGYWGGTNSININEIAERYSLEEGAQLNGISLGVGKITLNSPLSDSELAIKIYSGSSHPEYELYVQRVRMNDLAENAMNNILLNEIVEVGDTFFVSIKLDNFQDDEEFVLYQSLRDPGSDNFFWYKQNNQWKDFRSTNEEGFSITNVISILACNIFANNGVGPVVIDEMDAVVFPNPANDIFVFEAGQTLVLENMKVYNLAGQVVPASLKRIGDKKVQIDLANNLPGIYFVRYNSDMGSLTEKVMYYPDRY